MSHPDNIFEATRTAEIEVAIEEIFGVIEIFELLVAIDLLMIYKCGIRIDNAGRDITTIS